MKKHSYFLSLVMAFFSFIVPIEAMKPHSRSFHFDYRFTISNLPENAKEIKIWVPYPQNKEYQKVKIAKETEFTKKSIHVQDPQYQNDVLFFLEENPSQKTLDFSIQYEISRKEHSKALESLLEKKVTLSPKDQELFLKSSERVSLSPRIQKLAKTIVKEETSPFKKAKAIYDYVLNHMVYDKNTPGWGQGDSERACIIGKGNCTDFHSLFIALARASGIPAKFIIGVPLKKATKGNPSGYHCWASFFDPKRGWVPVDISEAWKNPSLKNYFFGSIEADRLSLTEGRDLFFTPKQKENPLNYFVYPYVEIDGKKHNTVEVHFSYENL